MSRVKAIAISLLVVFLASILLMLFVVPPFIDQFQELIQLIPIGIERLGEWLDSLMKKQVNLLPAITLIAQIFFSTFLGLLGLILALPLVFIVKTWTEEILIKDFLNNR